MAQREALRDLQTRLAERLQAARTGEGQRAWLAVEVAGTGFLFPLDQAGEIFPPCEILPLPHARPWFLGVANLRGGLHGVVDLGIFLGLRATQAAPAVGRDSGRLLALNPALRALSALRIDRMAGLRRPAELAEIPVSGARPSFAGRVWRESAGRQWQEIDLAALASSDTFLSIAAPEAA
jgi:twitching motility protein PilI